MNLKKIIIAVCAILVIGCKSDSGNEFLNNQQIYDIQKEEIQNYLELNYYDADDTTSPFKLIGDKTDKVALINDANLKSTKTSIAGVEYLIYTYLTKQEEVNKKKTNIVDANDIANLDIEAYELSTGNLIEKDSKGNTLISEQKTFVYLENRKDPLAVSLPFFRGGSFQESDPTSPRKYTGGSEGYIFMPSKTIAEFSFSSIFVVLYKVRLKYVEKIED